MYYFLSFLALIICSTVANTQKPDVIKISMLYDALSPNTKDFVTNQLVPSYKLISDRIILELIPYGTTERLNTQSIKNQTEFKCTNGDEEYCKADIIHACAFNQTQNQQQQMKFLSCIIVQSKQTTHENIQHCAQEANLSVEKIVECMIGPKGIDLLSFNGYKSAGIVKAIHESPIFAINGSILIGDRPKNDFLKTVCSYINNPPEACKV